MLEAANTAFPILTVLGAFLALFIFTSLLFGKNTKPFALISQNALLLAFLVALGATLGSLFYSEIIGYEPCKLCWFQRIFIYPQVIILGLAILKKTGDVKNIIITLSLAGAAFAVYHNFLQWGFVREGWCSGEVVSCAQNFVLAFGYITIPLMSLITFLLIIALMLTGYKLRNSETLR